MFGPLKMPGQESHPVKDLSRREIATLAPLAVACLALGLYPNPVLKSLDEPIERLIAPARLVISATSPNTIAGVNLDNTAQRTGN